MIELVKDKEYIFLFDEFEAMKTIVIRKFVERKNNQNYFFDENMGIPIVYNSNFHWKIVNEYTLENLMELITL